MKNALRLALFAALHLLLPNTAFADNCSGFGDCYGTMAPAVLAVTGVATAITLTVFWNDIANAGTHVWDRLFPPDAETVKPPTVGGGVVPGTAEGTQGGGAPTSSADTSSIPGTPGANQGGSTPGTSSPSTPGQGQPPSTSRGTPPRVGEPNTSQPQVPPTPGNAPDGSPSAGSGVPSAGGGTSHSPQSPAGGSASGSPPPSTGTPNAAAPTTAPAGATSPQPVLDDTGAAHSAGSPPAAESGATVSHGGRQDIAASAGVEAPGAADAPSSQTPVTINDANASGASGTTASGTGATQPGSAGSRVSAPGQTGGLPDDQGLEHVSRSARPDSAPPGDVAMADLEHSSGTRVAGDGQAGANRLDAGLGRISPADALPLKEAAVFLADAAVLKDHPFASWLADVNPSGSRINAGHCVHAVNAWLEGNPASAPDEFGGTFEQIAAVYGSEWEWGTQFANIFSVLAQAGAGARGLVGWYSANGSHVLNAVNLAGKPYFIDGNAGLVYASGDALTHWFRNAQLSIGWLPLSPLPH